MPEPALNELDRVVKPERGAEPLRLRVWLPSRRGGHFKVLQALGQRIEGTFGRFEVFGNVEISAENAFDLFDAASIRLEVPVGRQVIPVGLDVDEVICGPEDRDPSGIEPQLPVSRSPASPVSDIDDLEVVLVGRELVQGHEVGDGAILVQNCRFKLEKTNKLDNKQRTAAV